MTDATEPAAPPSGFFDPADFPFTGDLERAAPAIREELERVMTGSSFLPWPETELYGGRWDVFGLYVAGRRLPANCDRCPSTAAVAARVPGLTLAGFSRLASGAHIRPHVGGDRGVLRCHLGVVVPPDCALRVGGETRRWEERRCLVFDDTIEHEAWNRSDAARIVLLLDFLRTGW